MKNTELASLLRRLERPSGPVDVVLDTDTFNEVDDQFALSYLLASQEKLKVQALYAAPFFNEKSSSPEDGMLKSYEEILRLLKLCHAQELEDRVFQGSRGYLPDEKTPVASPAAEDLARRAMGYSPENPLYVIAIGAITNVASALLLEPAIAEKIDPRQHHHNAGAGEVVVGLLLILAAQLDGDGHRAAQADQIRQGKVDDDQGHSQVEPGKGGVPQNAADENAVSHLVQG